MKPLSESTKQYVSHSGRFVRGATSCFSCESDFAFNFSHHNLGDTIMKRSMKLTTVAALVAGCFTVPVVYAQTEDIPAPQPTLESNEETTLPTVTVSAQAERDTLTENTGSYTTGATNTTMKLPLTLRETPQTITVITRQQIEDFGLDTVDEVLQNTSSVSVWKGALGSGYYSRGFSMQNQYDGMVSPTTGVGIGWLGTSTPDTAFIDHVEIQQGAAGLMVGAGTPGGTLNMVRKLPTETFQAQAEVGYGSWDRRRLVGDISGPLTQSGALRGRVVLLSEDSDSYVDYGFTDKKGFYGVIEALPTDKTKIGLSLQYQKSRINEVIMGYPTAPDGSDLKWSRSTFFGDPKGGVTDENTFVSLYLEQRLTENWLLRGAYSHSIDDRNSVFASQFGTLDIATGDGLQAWGVHQRQKIVGDSVDVYVRGKEHLFGRLHEFALGFNGSNVKQWRTGSSGPYIPFNIYTYHPSAMPHHNPHLSLGDTDPDKTRQRGVWGVARLSLADSLTLILGTRVSWYGYWNTSGVQTKEETGVVTPYGGIVYDLNKQLSVYASYSDIFNPQTAMDRNGNILEPVVGANYEVGIKGEFFNKRLNTAAAIFRLEQTNLAETDADFGNPNGVCSGWCSIAQGKVISEGVDLSLNGALSSHWNVGAGYTYVKSEYATGDEKGDRYLPRNPVHAFRLSTTYRIPGSNWMVGGNLRAQSAVYALHGTAKIKQSAYSLLGLMAKYRINDQAEVSITADNVFDKRYRYPALTNVTQYGEPRRVFANLKYWF
jgi:outer membrane receptor for ferric coprogen and ferric-rhodotorulic acid